MAGMQSPGRGDLETKERRDDHLLTGTRTGLSPAALTSLLVSRQPLIRVHGPLTLARAAPINRPLSGGLLSGHARSPRERGVMSESASSRMPREPPSIDVGPG